MGLEGFYVYQASRVRGDVHDLKPAHCCRGRVGAVGRVGQKDLCALVEFFGALKVFFNKKHSRQLPVGSGGRLERDRVHAPNRAEIFPQFVHQLEGPLGEIIPLQGMGMGEPRQPRHIFVNSRIVLHGAAAQGIDAVIYPVVHAREFCVMADDLDLRDLGELWVFFTDELWGDQLREISLRDVKSRQPQAGAALLANIKDRRSHPRLLSRF
ncbi:hypothetical protein HRbin07_00598 [bacterium HR07]|nr:hypothetical protein HRbin07_00598 [bacterium HR07]